MELGYLESAVQRNIKAPLISMSADMAVKSYLEICKDVGAGERLTQLLMEMIHQLKLCPSSFTSVGQMSAHVGIGRPGLRKQLERAAELHLVQKVNVTTDPKRHRRGVCYKLSVMSGKHYAEHIMKASETPEIPSLPSRVSNVRRFKIRENHPTVSLDKLISTLVKCMRTNRKDKRQNLEIEVDIKGNKYPMYTTCEVGKDGNTKLMSVEDMPYFCAAFTRLVKHVSLLVREGAEVPETYLMPLDEIIILSKKVAIEDADTGGAKKSAIQALERISATTFNLKHLPVGEYSVNDGPEDESHIKLLRFESLVTTYDTNNRSRRVVKLQFSRYIVDIIRHIVRHMPSADRLTIVPEAVMTSKNPVEILFGVWAKNRILRTTITGTMYTLPELQKSIAPNIPISDFVVKFHKMVLNHIDVEFCPKLPNTRKKYDYQCVPGAYIYLKRGHVHVETGCAVAHGCRIVVGRDSKGNKIVTFKRHISSFEMLAEEESLKEEALTAELLSH